MSENPLCDEIQQGQQLETVIVVHGTFAAPEYSGDPKWYQPDQSFTTKLDEQLEKIHSPARCWAHLKDPDEDDEIFTWSGANDWIDRSKAAFRLSELISRLTEKGWRCHVVAHSHGGNVLAEALNILDRTSPSDWYRASFVTMGTPFLYNDTKNEKGVIKNALISNLIGVFLFSMLIYFLINRSDLSKIFSSFYGKQLSYFYDFYDSYIFIYGLIFVVLLILGVSKYVRSIQPKHTSSAPVGLEGFDDRLLAYTSYWDEVFLLLSNVQRAQKIHFKFIDYLNASKLSKSYLSEIILNEDKILFEDYPSNKVYYFLIPLIVGVMALPFLSEFEWVANLLDDAGGLFFLALAMLICIYRLDALVRIICFPWHVVKLVSFVVKSFLFRALVLVILPIIRSFTKIIVFGLSGHPFPRHEVSMNPKTAVKSYRLHLSSELNMKVSRIDEKNLSETLMRLRSSLADPFSTPFEILEKLKDIEKSTNLIHAAYYSEPECISNIAHWIARTENQIAAQPAENVFAFSGQLADERRN